MIDIDQIRRAQNEANLAREFAESLFESVQTPLVVLGRDLRIRMANRAFLLFYGLSHADIHDRTFGSPGGDGAVSLWSSPGLGAALDRVARMETIAEDLELEQELPDGVRKVLLVNARRVGDEGEFQILLTMTDITDRRRTETVLPGSENTLQRSREVRALTGSLLSAQDEERRRVSRELHDDVGQNMAKLQFDIETLEQSLPSTRQEDKDRLLQIRDIAAQLSNDLRRIAYALHPATLDHLGLTVALRALGREFDARTGMRVGFSTARVPEKLPIEISSAFYRIAQEALRNISKHAGGGAVDIRLTRSANHLILSIQDDGAGFDREAVRGNGGLGLISMEERARLIRAEFQLKTQPGQGTTITVSAPLLAEEAV